MKQRTRAGTNCTFHSEKQNTNCQNEPTIVQRTDYTDYRQLYTLTYFSSTERVSLLQWETLLHRQSHQN